VTEYSATDIQGFLPAVEPTRTEKLLLLNGQNYIFDARGPKSPFGNRLLLPFALGRPEHVQGIRLKLRTGDRCFTITSDAILEWVETTGGWQIVYIFDDIRSNPYRWTHGYLNDVMFFCHPSVGILAYDLTTNQCTRPTANGIPMDAIAIDINNGRLVVITPELFAWSSPSNGLDFTPALGGAGFQKISNHVAGSPIMVTSYTRGCLIWTTGGVMRSEFTGDVAVYHHRALNTEYRPVNSFCTCRVDDDTVIILDERGLFQSTGESPQPFAPLFNEFLIEYIQKNKLRQGNNLRLEWDELKRHMFVSASLSITSPLYEFCFVYYPPLDKWGQFCETHYGILPVKIDTSERADDYYGFVDIEGFVRYWLDTGSRELSVADSVTHGAHILFYPRIQAPVTVNTEGETTLGSTLAAYSYDPSPFLGRAGYYPSDGFALVPPELTGLDAKIQIGLLRFSQNESADEMSEITNIVLRSIQSGDADQVSLDYNLVPAAATDYNLTEGETDFGFETLNYVNHGLKVIGTLDGVTEFLSVIPDIVGFTPGARYYSCSCVGVWHIFELTAEAVGEAFHLFTFKVTAVSAGRLV
jgi:hypothetical protein